MIENGLDRLLEHEGALRGRRYGLLSHCAAVSAALEPATQALASRHAEPPSVLFAPEHGFFAAEQDMIGSEDSRDPVSGIPTVSLYGSDETSLRPSAEAFDGLDLLVVDLVDIGSRYYTYAATAVWSAEVAIGIGIEVWILDRPNPLGGLVIEGNFVEPGFYSLVGAFSVPVRHGLTLGELVLLQAGREGWDGDGLEVRTVEGWHREVPTEDRGWFWRAPSPNMPTRKTAWLYPGACLVEGTVVSEGRGTTRPFELIGAPGFDGRVLAATMNAKSLPGVRYLPVQFRPQFQKHAAELCSGVEVVVTDRTVFEPYRSGVELIAAMFDSGWEDFAWRRETYEFVRDRLAIDLLAGTNRFREALEGGEVADWIRSWSADEESFLEERESVLLYRP